MESKDLPRDGEANLPRKEPWWLKLLRHAKIVRGYDKDFGEKMKIGIKFKFPWG